MTFTFEDLRKDPFQSKLIAAIESNLGTPLPPELQQFILSLALNSDQRADHTQQWLNEAASLAEAVSKGTAHPAEYALFWIRIHSILFEYIDTVEKRRITYELFPAGIELLKAATELKDLVTEEELTYIYFMRNSHCHIQVDYYLYQLKLKDGKVVGGKSPKDPNIMDTVRKVLGRHGFDQPKVAAEYAMKLHPKLEELAKYLLKLSQ